MIRLRLWRENLKRKNEMDTEEGRENMEMKLREEREIFENRNQ